VKPKREVDPPLCLGRAYYKWQWAFGCWIYGVCEVVGLCFYYGCVQSMAVVYVNNVLQIIYARRIRLTADPSFAPMCSSGDWSIARVRSSRIALMSAWPKVKPPGCPAPASCANWRENTPQSTIPSCMLLRHIPKALRPGSSLDITNIIGHAKRAANQSSAQGRQSSCRSSAQGRQSSGRSSEHEKMVLLPCEKAAKRDGLPHA